MTTQLKRFQRAIAIHGIWGTAKLSTALIFRKLFWSILVRQGKRNIFQERKSEFDRQWGVDTGGSFIPEEAEIVGSNWKYGIKYEGCNATALAEVLTNLPIQYEEFTFVDFGSGKGRAILVASTFPFQKIIGVEYSQKLCNIARQNMSYSMKNEKKCEQIDIICTDALDFQIPQGPLVLFFFNPFGKQIMKQVVQNRPLAKLLPSYVLDIDRLI